MNTNPSEPREHPEDLASRLQSEIDAAAKRLREYFSSDDTLTKSQVLMATDMVIVADAYLALRKQHGQLVAALRPIWSEIQDKVVDCTHESWVETAHCEITLTIAECRAIRAALALTETKV